MDPMRSNRSNMALRALKGMKKGMEEGMEKGLQEGLQKGKESTARNMKAEGITPLIIQKCTGLSLEEIERL